MRLRILNPSNKERGVQVNVTSHSTGWGKELSPFFLPGGKTWTGDWAVNMENIWQYSKVYPIHYDELTDEPTPDWLIWAKNGWEKTRADRYPMGKGAVPKYSYWDGKKYFYLQAKEKLYLKMYWRAAKSTSAFKKLQELYEKCKTDDIDLVLVDFDAYDHHKLRLSLHDVVHHPGKKFGHGFVLALMLENLIDSTGKLKEL